jgi:hypothetical protein
VTDYTPGWDLSTIPDPAFNSEIGRRRGARGAARPKVLRPCQSCGLLLGARERRGVCPGCGTRQTKTA